MYAKTCKKFAYFLFNAKHVKQYAPSPLPPHPTRPRPRPCNACTRALRSPPCHPELVVTRLCCQHFAEQQNARLARRLLLFPKISLRCDFREPYYHSPPSGVILRVCVSEDKRLPFLAFPLFKGEGGPLAVDEGCNILISLSPLPSLRDTFPRGGRQDLCYSKQILKKRQNHAFASFLFYKQFCASESRAFR